MPQLTSPHGMHAYSPNRVTPIGLPPPSPQLGAQTPSAAAAASSAAAAAAPFVPAASECLVVVAHSGREFECPLSPSLTLEALRSSLASPTGVSERDEVLLVGADGAHLSSIQQLAAPGTTLFVYHKLYASADAPKPAPASSSAAADRPPMVLQPPVFPVLDVNLPTAADVSSGLRPRSSLLSHTKVKVRNLPEYERSMLEHRLTGEAYQRALSDAAQQGRKFLGQFQNILSSIDVALVALDDHGSRLSATVDAARTKIDPMLREQKAVLDNFAADVERLKDTEIKPPMRKYALAAMSAEDQAIHNNAAAAAGSAAAAGASTSATAAASSSVPRLTLHSWLAPSLPGLAALKARAAKDHEALSTKYAAFLDLWAAVQKKVQGALHVADGAAAGATSPSAVAVAAHPGIVAPIRPSLHRSAAVDAVLARIQSLIQFAVTTSENSQDLSQLVRDQEAITEYCNKLEAALASAGAAGAAGNLSSSSILSPDVVAEAAAMADRFDALGTDHEEQIIPRFKSAHDQMRAQLLPALAEANSVVQSVFLAQMNVIHSASTDLRSLSRSFPPLQESIMRLHSPSFRPTLLSISQLPTAYIHLLHELHRRRGFRRGFEAELQAMSTRVHRLVDIEERPRRARFHELYGMFLPAGATATTAAPSTPSSGAGTPTPKTARSLRWVGGFGALLKALQESPPKMDFSFDNFDSALPELDAASLPKLPAASSGSSPSAPASSLSMHRSPSGRDLHKATLPVIDESSTEASSSVSPTPAHAGTTPGPAALAAEFPWVEQLTVTQAALATATAREAELLAKIAEMERQQAASTIAASLATGGAPAATNSPKLASRKGSLSSDPSSLSSPSSAAGPSSRATHKADSAKNAEGLEKLLSAKQDELQRVKDHLAATVALLTSERSKHETDLASERAKLETARAEQTAEMMRMGAGAARQIKDIADLKAQIADLQSWKQKHQHDADAVADVRNDLIAVQNFALGDTVLFVRLPPPAPAAIAAANGPVAAAPVSASAPAPAASSMSAVSVGSASASASALSAPQFGPFEAFNIARPFFFLSPDCEEGWRNLLDERMAQEAQSEESPSPAVVAARAIAAQKAASDAAAANNAAASAAKESRPGVMTRLAAAVGVGGGAAALPAPAPASPAAAAVAASSMSVSASSSSSSALLPPASAHSTTVVAEFTARIIYIHEERVTRPAIAAKYSLPMGAVFHLLDVEAMQPIRGNADITVQMPPRVVAQM